MYVIRSRTQDSQNSSVELCWNSNSTYTHVHIMLQLQNLQIHQDDVKGLSFHVIRLMGRTFALISSIIFTLVNKHVDI